MKTGNNETSDGICPHCGGRGFIQTVFIRTENTMKPEENSGVTKLSNYPEGNTGVEKETEKVFHGEIYKTHEELYTIHIVDRLQKENAELRQSLSELIPIAEDGAYLYECFSSKGDKDITSERYKLSINKAKKLI
jgi:hypothetical protein